MFGRAATATLALLLGLSRPASGRLRPPRPLAPAGSLGGPTVPTEAPQDGPLPRDILEASEAFETLGRTPIAKGDLGKVFEIDGNGDARMRFDRLVGYHTVLKKDFGKLNIVGKLGPDEHVFEDSLGLTTPWLAMLSSTNASRAAAEVSPESADVVLANSTGSSFFASKAPTVLQACINCAERQAGECYYYRCGYSKVGKFKFGPPRGKWTGTVKLNGWCAGTRADHYHKGSTFPFKGAVCVLPEGWAPSTPPPPPERKRKVRVKKDKKKAEDKDAAEKKLSEAVSSGNADQIKEAKEEARVAGVSEDAIKQNVQAALRVGDMLETSEAFETDTDHPVKIEKGVRGRVTEIDGEGDAHIKFDSVCSEQWVYKEKFGKLKRVGNEGR